VLGRYGEEVAVLNRALRRLDATPSSPTRDREEATSLTRKGFALSELGRYDEAIAAYDRVIDQFGETVDADLGELVAGALNNRSAAEFATGRHDEACRTRDLMAQWIEVRAATEPRFRATLAQTYVGTGQMLSELGRRDDAMSMYKEVVERFGRSDEPGVARSVADSLIERANLLTRAGRRAEAQAELDEFVRLLPALQIQVCWRRWRMQLNSDPVWKWPDRPDRQRGGRRRALDCAMIEAWRRSSG
jgi:tetratricopeptide (TPR) repeat protein